MVILLPQVIFNAFLLTTTSRLEHSLTIYSVFMIITLTCTTTRYTWAALCVWWWKWCFLRCTWFNFGTRVISWAEHFKNWQIYKLINWNLNFLFTQRKFWVQIRLCGCPTMVTWCCMRFSMTQLWWNKNTPGLVLKMEIWICIRKSGRFGEYNGYMFFISS